VLFEPLWRREEHREHHDPDRRVDRVGTRGDFYDQTGRAARHDPRTTRCSS
jgi:hypothetical protein